jgi:hypothetical protein
MHLSFNEVAELKVGDSIIEDYSGQPSSTSIIVSEPIAVSFASSEGKTLRQIAFVAQVTAGPIDKGSLTAYLFTDAFMHYCPNIRRNIEG